MNGVKDDNRALDGHGQNCQDAGQGCADSYEAEALANC